jgi:hypothetical protein
MTDEQLQKKLNQLARLANELDDEAKRRHGSQGYLFFEADGSFHIMSGDSDGGASARQAFITLTSDIYCKMGAGCW